MKRAKGATLAEIMAATGWQPHTVRGFVSILGSNAAGVTDRLWEVSDLVTLLEASEWGLERAA